MKNKTTFKLIAALMAVFCMMHSKSSAQGLYVYADSTISTCTYPVTTNFYLGGYQNGGFLPTDSVIITAAFGDGTFATQIAFIWQSAYVNASIAHTYNFPGQYTAQFIVTWPDNHIDTALLGPLYVDTCVNVSGSIFLDDNNDCIQNSGESLFPYAILWIENQQNGNITYAFTDMSGNYSFNLPIGQTVNISVHEPSLVGLITCPSSGIQTVTGTSNAQYVDFGVTCNGQYDLSTFLSGNRFRPGFTGWIWSNVYTESCHPITTVNTQLTLDPLVSYSSDYYGVPSSSVVGQDVFWNNLPIVYFAPGGNYACTEFFTPTTAQIGDTVCFTLSVGPVANDINPVNNTFTQCYAVTNSWDPNAKEVFPTGNGPEGYVPQNTEFNYTIHFQNTGTDTAYNVSIIDTIDFDLDFSSLEIMGASHPMTIDVIDGQILKFNFYNIMLPDSGVNMPGSMGIINYRIKAKPNALPGTDWKNTAYIYFDFNEAIITNTTLNTLELLTNIEESVTTGLLPVPNPASDEIHINFEVPFSGAISITDITGKLVKQVSINNSNKVTISTAQLSNGLYQITTTGNINKGAKIQVNH